MTDRWTYPVMQAMQRHTGCQYVKPKIAPPTVPDVAPQPETSPSLVPDKVENPPAQ